MVLDTAAEWRSQAEGWMVEQVKTQVPPERAAQAKDDARWWGVFSFYAEAKLAEENLHFLEAVDEFKRSQDVSRAQDVYRQFVGEDAPERVNLYDRNFTDLKDVFEADVVLASVDIFDPACDEVLNTLDQDTYRFFIESTRRAREELREEDARQGGARDTAVQDTAAQDTAPGDTAFDDAEVGDPTAVEMSRDRIDMAVVDNFNELSLKSLDEGISTNFDQLDDLVIIHGPMAIEDQPYLKWLRSQPGYTRSGMVTMTAKGGVFSAGSISVSGATDRDAFKKAVARVSKKKVVFRD